MTSIVSQTMVVNNKANEELNLGLLKTYEAGSALAIDGASYEQSKQVTGSDCSYLPFGVHVTQAVAVPGSVFPERFLAVGATYPIPTTEHCATGSCPDSGTLLAFERVSSSAPWKIVLEPSVESGPFTKLSAEGSTATAATTSEEAAGKSVPSQLAAALTTYASSGALGPLKPSWFTGSCWALPDAHQQATEQLKVGVVEHETFTTTPDLEQYAVVAGGVLDLFTLDFETQQVPAGASGSISWVSEPNTDPVSGLLPSGQYSRITETGSLQIAAIAQRNGTFALVGDYYGVISVKGVKAPGSSSGGGGGGILVSYVPRLGMNSGR